MKYWGGQKILWPPQPKYWGGPWPPGPPTSYAYDCNVSDKPLLGHYVASVNIVYIVGINKNSTVIKVNCCHSASSYRLMGPKQQNIKL